MPPRSKKPCNKIGCPNLTRTRYCDKHQQDARHNSRRYRGNTTDRGYGHQWQRVRKRYAQRNPLCEHCLRLGQTRPMQVVDHIVPVIVDRSKVHDDDNLQSLCDLCHGVKTAADKLTYPDHYS